MDTNKIELETIDKLFEFERQSRIIDTLSDDELRKFSKLYLKLYLKQQEVVSSMTQS